MTCRILTNQIANIDALIHDPYSILSNAEEGVLAICITNVPAFYAVTPERMAELLEIEARSSCTATNITLDNQFFEELPDAPIFVPKGKFAMYASWKPDDDFQRQAALWGIRLTQPVTTGELAAFTAYWQAEGKVFHHVQWQQKLARSLQIRRSNRNLLKCDMNQLSEPDKQIPKGFRGAK